MFGGAVKLFTRYVLLCIALLKFPFKKYNGTETSLLIIKGN